MSFLHNGSSVRISKGQHIGRMWIRLYYENVGPIAIPIWAWFQVRVNDVTNNLLLALESNAIAGPVITSVDVLDTHALKLVYQCLLLLGDSISEGNIRKYAD